MERCRLAWQEDKCALALVLYWYVGLWCVWVGGVPFGVAPQDGVVLGHQGRWYVENGGITSGVSLIVGVLMGWLRWEWSCRWRDGVGRSGACVGVAVRALILWLREESWCRGTGVLGVLYESRLGGSGTPWVDDGGVSPDGVEHR